VTKEPQELEELEELIYCRQKSFRSFFNPNEPAGTKIVVLRKSKPALNE
jgi:hypothetical protein